MMGDAKLARRPAVFIDKDGTLVENVPYNVDPALLRFTSGAIPALRALADQGYVLIVVSNQSGIARGYFDEVALEKLVKALTAQLADQQVPLTAFYACPHASEREGTVGGCTCRKPRPGMLLRAAAEHGVDLSRSWMIGDILDDVEAGVRAGCKSILLDVGHETVWAMSPWREPHHRVQDLMEAARIIMDSDAAVAHRERTAIIEPPTVAEPTLPSYAAGA